MAALAKPDPLPIGVLKTFGDYDPMYEVLGPARDGPKGSMVHIRVFFTEEELDDPLAEMLEDSLKP